MAYRYEAPLDDMRFVIERVLQAPASWRACAAFAELDIDTGAAVLEEAARFASELLQPLSASGDLQGCTRAADGSVRTPEGWPAAYRAFVEAGWPALPCDPAWGGQGLPLLLDAALREMLSACNHGWNMYPDLLHGAYETIKAHGSEELKARYLEDIATGRLLAAMALTEPGAGSDLGALRTRAEVQPDGSLRVSGHKIFISGGEHDLTEQIVHLVLCREAGMPAGSKGLSLALVPKWLPDGARNAMHCDGIEKKMGIKGSATCAMRYEAATGWRVGEPGRGLAAMFLMMNSARLHVGLQGLGHQEMASQNALRYAREREQFRLPIVQQPAVRHTLLRLRAVCEAQRVIAYRAALAIDEAQHHGDPAARERQGRIAALLTPVVKTACSAAGFHGAAAAQQVWGGYGYVHEYGVEQTVRDARIAMVYEGTNEIQAIDLVQRKLLGDGGRAFAELVQEWRAEAEACATTPALADFGAALHEQLALAERSLQALQHSTAADTNAPLRLADEVMAGLTHTLMAWAFAASARAAVDHPDRVFGERKTTCMRYGVQWLLPQAAVHWQRVGSSTLPLPVLG